MLTHPPPVSITETKHKIDLPLRHNHATSNFFSNSYSIWQFFCKCKVSLTSRGQSSTLSPVRFSRFLRLSLRPPNEELRRRRRRRRRRNYEKNPTKGSEGDGNGRGTVGKKWRKMRTSHRGQRQRVAVACSRLADKSFRLCFAIVGALVGSGEEPWPFLVQA